MPGDFLSWEIWKKWGDINHLLGILITNVEKQSRKVLFSFLSFFSYMWTYIYRWHQFLSPCKYFEDSLIIYMLFNLIENGRILFKNIWWELRPPDEMQESWLFPLGSLFLPGCGSRPGVGMRRKGAALGGETEVRQQRKAVFSGSRLPRCMVIHKVGLSSGTVNTT